MAQTNDVFDTIEKLFIIVSAIVIILSGILQIILEPKEYYSTLIMGVSLISLGTLTLSIFLYFNSRLLDYVTEVSQRVNELIYERSYLELFRKIDVIKNPNVKKYYTKKLNEIHREIDSLRRREIQFPPDIAYAFSIDAIKSARKHICATSWVKPEEFWLKDPGKRYLKAHKIPLKKGVKIRRVFIFDSESDITKTVLEIIEEQLNIGIEVRYVVAPRNELCFDILIVDDEFVEKLELDVKGRPSHVCLMFNEEKIREFKGKFEELWIISEALDKEKLNLLKNKYNPTES